MRRRTLGYEDAVRILGGESAVLRAFGWLSGAGLTVASAGGSELALSLFDLKGEVERLSQDAVSTVRRRVGGLTRFERSELLEAAHVVIVIAAFFTALDDLDGELRTTLNTTTLELVRAEQAALATGRPVQGGRIAELVEVLNTPGNLPDMGAHWRQTPLLAYYQTLARRLLEFGPGTAAWDGADETTRLRWAAGLETDLPRLATTRYERMLRQLASDYPEVAFWAHQAGVRVLLDELKAARQDVTETGTKLAGLARMVRWMAQGRAPDALRSALSTEYRAQVDRPLTDPDAVPDGVRLPKLREVYVNPSYRRLTGLGRAAEQPEQVSEAGWRNAELGDDLETFLVQHLISPAATKAPLVVLGQPGAGKSLLTQMLAAQLPPDDYLVVRVELRDVSADADIQHQIEEALQKITRVEHEWQTVSASCAPALPVVLLDGFDELLQASNTVHYDYLEKVKDFQDRGARHGHPAAVIVTSRTAVADQVRYPRESVVVQLEEFTDAQVRRWIERWRAANPQRALNTEEALVHGEIARQPLLLFMLALFHADGGELQGKIGQTELYESLFSRFAEREVDKRGRHLGERDRRMLIARELYLMSMVAFSMFNRSSQSVTDEGLARDLAALPFGGDPRRRDTALDTAQEVAGRFFFKLFVHRNQAVEGHTLHRRYEFLHSSFGEFLVGRWIADELVRVAGQLLKNADDPIPVAPDDTRLRTLVSFAVLAGRARVVEVIADRFRARSSEELVELRALLIRLFRECMDSRAPELLSPAYEPVRLGVPARFAVYSANLCTLLVHAAGALAARDPSLTRISLAELGFHEDLDEASRSFFAITRSWHAHLNRKSWHAMLDVIRVTDSSGSRDFHLSSWNVAEIPGEGPNSASDLLAGLTVRTNPPVLPGTWVGQVFRETALLDSETQHRMLTTLLPFLEAAGLFRGTEFPIGSSGALAMELLVHRRPFDAVSRSDCYIELLDREPEPNIGFARLFLGALRNEPARVQALVVTRAWQEFERLAWAHITAFLDALRDCLVSQFEAPPPWSFHPRFTDPIDVHNYCALLGFREVPHHFDVRDLACLLVLRDLMGLGTLDQVEALCQAVPHWEPPGHQELVQVALWAAMAERDLVAYGPPSINLSREQAERLDEVAPGYLTGISELATLWRQENPVVIR
ncbi:AAA family ATPase [Nonomuraea sp. NPDC048916]|uniref:NACHT domain-containing protein n=1 Tax=Nonomuraea sp. NPDC048916 TaxID=3154232 RepID=UPI003402ECD7